jgi:hypothetical protein
MGADETEDLADEIDSRLADKFPLQSHVFIDPTQASRAPSHATGPPPGQG